MQTVQAKTQVDWVGLSIATPGFSKEAQVSDAAGIGIETEFREFENISFSDLLGTGEGSLLSPHNLVLGSTLQVNDGFPVPDQHSYDLKFPPDMEGHASQMAPLDISRFTPMTPNKAGRAESTQLNEMQSLHVCEGRAQESNAENAAERIDLRPSQPVKDNHNMSAEGGSHPKTPQQKPRRRKHRPRIFIQGQKPKQTTKPVTPRSGGSKENVTVQRKYVRKNEVSKLTTPSAQVNPATPAKNSCRRTLGFDAQEQQEHGSSMRKPISNLDSESRQGDFCTGGVPSVSPNDPTCSTGAAAMEEVQARTSKRKCSDVIEEASNTSKTRVLYNSFHVQATKQGPVDDTHETRNPQKVHACVQDHQIVLQQFSAKSSGAAVEVIRQGFIDVITEKLKRLDINRESDTVPCNQDSNALVLYRSDDGTIVPFKPGKARRPQPKVDIDEETNRVYRLLLQNINNEGIDGTDEEKKRWWEEERRVFSGRADLFVTRMHLVQGDRRFSPWKGSIVDSVVGVFLTQNVSDHLSSSAFMSIAARYPLGSNSKSNQKPLHEEEPTLLVQEPQVCMPDQDPEEIQNVSNHNEVVNNNVCPAIKTVDVSSIEEIDCSSLSSSKSCVETYLDPATKITRTETAGFARYHVATNYVVSSQESVNSLQSTAEYERIGSYSETGSEAEKLKNKLELNNLNDYTSSMDLLRTSDTSTLTAEPTSQGTAQEKVAMTYKENIQPSNHQGQEILIQSQDTNAETVGPVQQALNLANPSAETLDIGEIIIVDEENDKQKAAEKEMNSAKQKSKRVGLEINNEFDWDTLRREVEANGKKQRLSNTIDSVDWEAVRCADVNEIAETIKERGMNNILAGRIKAFLNRVVNDHGSIDLEWLRGIEPDKAKEYLLSIHGLGLKSVECIRLLALQHHAFPVDTNVGRIAVRLGWVPLQPLPESLQLHLLELHPIMDTFQKYLWPRLCKLDEKELYELHYQMITFGKVFCTKSKPNCNSCPMRGDCRHFASAFASARLALRAPEQNTADTAVPINALPLLPPQATQQLEASLGRDEEGRVGHCEPIIEEPASPEPERTQHQEHDIEEFRYDDDDPDDIPTIKMNVEEFTHNLRQYLGDNMGLQEGDMSKALVALTPQEASIPMPSLRTARFTPSSRNGETATSMQPPEGGCSYRESGKLCDQNTCFACNSVREANSQMVRGTLLIPCRTAMRGRFPLNGTYFQVNEVFADHATSLNPIDIRREWLWNLPRRTVYFGTSVTSIFRGLSTEEVQLCFWRGQVCVRGMDRETRAPRPLMARLHTSANKMPPKAKVDK